METSGSFSQNSRTSLVVTPQEVAVPLSNITAASTDSRPTISFYVQLPNNTFVSSAVLRDAIEQATDLYQQAGHVPRKYIIVAEQANRVEPH